MYYATYRDAQGATIVGKSACIKSVIDLVQGTCGYVEDHNGRRVWPLEEEA